MMEQPLSLLADDNECTMLSFDNGVSQQQVEELVLEDEDMQEIENCVPRESMAGLSRYGGALGKRVFTLEENITLQEWDKRNQ